MVITISMVIAIFIGLWSVVTGIVLMTRGVVSILRRRRQIATSLSADGVITSIETEWAGGEDGKYFYHPLVQFKVPSGQEVSFRSPIGRTVGYFVGQRVKVLYDPRNPQEAE